MARPAKPRPLGEYHDALSRAYKQVAGDGQFGEEDKRALLDHLAGALAIVQRTMRCASDEPSAQRATGSKSRR